MSRQGLVGALFVSGLAVLSGCESGQRPVGPGLHGSEPSYLASGEQTVPWIDDEAEFHDGEGKHYRLVRFGDAAGRVIGLEIFENGLYTARIDVAHASEEVEEIEFTDPSTGDYVTTDGQGNYLRSSGEEDGGPGSEPSEPGCNKEEDDGEPCDQLLSGGCDEQKDKMMEHATEAAVDLAAAGIAFKMNEPDRVVEQAISAAKNAAHAAIWAYRYRRCRLESEPELAWSASSPDHMAHVTLQAPAPTVLLRAGPLAC
jgi:hypothetical protein